MFGGLPSLNIAGLSIGLRDVVLGLVVLVAVYIVFVLLRMQRLQRERERSAPTPAAHRAESTGGESDPGLAAVDTLDAQEIADADLPLPDVRIPVGEIRRDDMATRELAMLRDEVDAIRGELAALRNDMHQELAHLRATQSVSPIYGDAMQMAAAGYDAATIAERCGIARAEADLVVALARSQAQ
ncbi:DUF2802 domain-containing protein [Azonexus sp. R2A61]|uniref:DUF2802 domain-containing protein n=1 Tax=Azonexus sp. R2A61 TaxID=2744443 RepID=UPI001F15AA9C